MKYLHIRKYKIKHLLFSNIDNTFSKNPIIVKYRVKTSLFNYLMENLSLNDKTQCQQCYSKMSVLIHCWWKYELIQLFWKVTEGKNRLLLSIFFDSIFLL